MKHLEHLWESFVIGSIFFGVGCGIFLAVGVVAALSNIAIAAVTGTAPHPFSANFFSWPYFRTNVLPPILYVGTFLGVVGFLTILMDDGPGGL